MRREDGGEEPGHSNRDQRPDEKEMSRGTAEAAGDTDTLPSHVEEGNGQRKEPSEEDNDVPGSPFREH